MESRPANGPAPGTPHAPFLSVALRGSRRHGSYLQETCLRNVLDPVVVWAFGYFGSHRFQPVTQHNLAEAFLIWRASGTHQGPDIAEVVRTEYARCNGRKEARGLRATILKLVRGASRDENRLAGCYWKLVPFDHESAYSGESVYRFIVGHMTVRRRYAHIGRNNYLEEHEGSLGIRAFKQIPNLNPPDDDDFFGNGDFHARSRSAIVLGAGPFA